MKKGLTFLFVLGLITLVDAQSLPKIELESVKGQTIGTDSLFHSDKPIVVSFWATWCAPCIKELSTISENIDDWKSELEFEFMAISVDDARTVTRVRPFAEGRRWDFPIYLDKNADLQRAMGVNAPPHTFIIYKGEIVWQHVGYVPGDEEEVFEKLDELQ